MDNNNDDQTEHEHQTSTEFDECSKCGCLSIIYEYCRECGHYRELQNCNCLDEDYGGDYIEL